MQYLNKEQAIGKINEFARRRKPFIFVIDFSTSKSVVLSPEAAAKHQIYFTIGNNYTPNHISIIIPKILFHPMPMPFREYEHAFGKVIHHIKRGDSYLLNLTFPTKIQTNLTLSEIFEISHAPYKLFFNGQFVSFSPEIFIRIRDGKIYSYPMKGTINADIPNAEEKIMSDEKEFFEHNTIVDLIRNDLAMVSSDITVNRFRYIDHIRTNRQELLQVSSEIAGNLPEDHLDRLGEIMFTLLPAGSVTGAPKERTVHIIRSVETSDRGFYTGIFGYFDGKNLESAVTIRFIEMVDGMLYFRSGGGITALSDARKEYEELIQKVYVPVI